MTPTRRRRPSGISLDPDELRYATAAAAPPDTASRSKAKKAQQPAPRQEATPTRPRARNAAPAEVTVIEVPDALEGEAYVGEEKVKIGTTLPLHLKGQVDGAVRFAQDSGGVDGIETITDFVRVACFRLVTDLQAKYNDGNEFRVPGINRRGRMPGR
jgi:hypothetical protein